MNTENTLNLCLNKSKESCYEPWFDELIIGSLTKITFNRTLRIPEDGKTYPLPAGLGRLPIHRVEDFAKRVPTKWLEEGGYFIPLHQKEALYLEFSGPEWHPSIAKVCVGKINAISGDRYSENISSHKQDYILVPQQMWLDGINAGDGVVRQFVAMPLGSGYSVEAQMTDEETFGGFQFYVMQAKDGRFPRQNPIWNNIFKKIQHAQKVAKYPISSSTAAHMVLNPEEKKLYLSLLKIEKSDVSEKPDIAFKLASGHEGDFLSENEDVSMAIAAGGSIKQEIFADTYGADTWDPCKNRLVTIHMVNSLAYEQITGEPPPPSPISQEVYKRYKIPWYSDYNETSPKIKIPSAFRRILGVSAIDKKRGLKSGSSSQSIDITPELIRKIRTPDTAEATATYRSRAYESMNAHAWGSARSEISHVIDLGLDVKSSDYAVRCCCNYHLQSYSDGEVDGSLALEMNSGSKDARSWRAYCRFASGNHEGLKEDADVLVDIPEVVVFGLQMRAEAAMLSGRYEDAITDALRLRKLNPSHARAGEILTEARSK